MHILILGGTTEASRLAQILAAQGRRLVLSLAGRTQQPMQPLPFRVGGFGGIDGLHAYLLAAQITHVIDATHPYAAQMSAHAAQACRLAGVSLVQLSRPAWAAQPGDRWLHVDEVAAARQALGDIPRRVLLSHGRQIGEFADAPHHFYLVRTIDPPAGLAELPHHKLILARGPFSYAEEHALLQSENIDLLVTKNSGGLATYPKIAAARDLHIPVVMIRRPSPENCAQAASVAEVLDWVEAHRAAP